MNNPGDLEIGNGLDVLRRLHQVLTAFAKEEAELTRQLRDRNYRLRRATEENLTAFDAETRSRQAAESESFAEEKRRHIDRHEARQNRIRTLYRDAMRDLPRLAREQRERWLGELQMKEFLITQRLDAERKKSGEEFEQFSEELTRQGAILQRLEQRSREYFLGYLSLLLRLRHRPAEEPPAEDPRELMRRLRESLDALHADLRAFRQLTLSRIFSFLPLPAVLVLTGVVTLLLARMNPNAAMADYVIGGVLAVAILVVHAIGKRQANSAAGMVLKRLNEARTLHQATGEAGQAGLERRLTALKREREGTVADVTGEWNRSGHIKIDFEERVRRRFDARLPRARAANDHALKRRLNALESAHAQREAATLARATRRNDELKAEGEAAQAGLAAEQAALHDSLVTRWRAAIDPIYAEVAAMNDVSSKIFPEWTPATVAGWTPPREFLPVTRFGHLDVDLSRMLGETSPLTLPGSSHLSIPLALTFPARGSLLLESAESGGAAVISCLNEIVLRLLATTPPGKLSFTIFDPVGLGQNFAGLMHLGDYEESLISRRIWTQSDHLEERLAELNQHIEKVIQMYLRNEYATIVEYNAQAGSTAEKFHFLVIADFPANFSETALKRLQSVLTSGPRCGVYTFIHWDSRHSLPAGFSADDLRKNSICIQSGSEGAVIETDSSTLDAGLRLDAAPDASLALELVQKIGRSNIDAGQVQVPFRAIAPEPAEFWKTETAQELRVAIGRTGATKRQIFALGKGTRQHALIAGKTGSGKSTLFHVLITNLALSCSPAEVEFYLVDFKKGVEFKCYATKRLPHARVVAIESDREFGLSVLQRVDAELRRRGDIFRRLGVQDLAGYQRANPAEPMPRSLLLIDEFQEFFVEDDAIAQNASVLLDRIVRQGRAFGIHAVLGSQTLGGAYSLARATLGQMVVRIALQCNEADAYLIMDDGNAAPRLLSRPGEGIYNDDAGSLEGNSPFQVVWLPESERDAWLDQVRDLARRNPLLDAAPIVFEGNAPADIADNSLLDVALGTPPKHPPAVARAWLGAPNSIKGPTEAAFARQSGSHLLVVGQRDEASWTMLGTALLALTAQYPAGTARFVFLHASPPQSEEIEFLSRLVDAAPHEVRVASGPAALDALADVAGELRRRIDDGIVGEEIFVFVHGMQRFKKLRPVDEFDFSTADADGAPKPSAQFSELLAEGGDHGIHLLVAFDTFNNLGRFVNRKALAEFEMRVVFQMSANDSAALIDSPAAGALGMHRAIFYNEHDGTLETFRPYARPDAAWVQSLADKRPAPEIIA